MVAQTENQQRHSLKFHFHSQMEETSSLAQLSEEMGPERLPSHKESIPDAAERVPSLCRLVQLTTKRH